MPGKFPSAPTIVFHDPNYPNACSETTLARLIPGEFHMVQASELAASLADGAETLLSFHGPYFPREAWGALLQFLEAGGNLAVFGGMPFTRPVAPDGLIEIEQQAYTRQLGLGPHFPLAVAGPDLHLEAAEEAAFLADCPLQLDASEPGTFWSCYPKLTQVSDHPEDMGSAGPLDTLLTPLLFVSSATARHLATPAFLLDQQSGRFNGGRWLISAWQPATEADWLANALAIQRLITLTEEGCTVLETRPVEASYHPGEAPTVLISARTRQDITVQLTISTPNKQAILKTIELTLPASPRLQEQRFQLPAQNEPGLYHVEVAYQRASGLITRQETGFWIWDASLVAATKDKKLTTGRDYFYQQERPFLVFGTTYMDSRVQRKFLTLPNPARWDTDFAEMKAAGINLIRTGIWTAWREIMPEAGLANEAALRAFDAFVMTACKHDIQVIFTFFAFSPPLFEGENPWLDPRSLQGQQDFLTVFARRYAGVSLVSWDLINEPSFGDPTKIFSQRPQANYDRFEQTAFRQWLAARYTLPELRLRWRQTPADFSSWEQVTPPHTADYSTNLHDTNTRQMLKVMDYTLFSQEMFKEWAASMYATLRAAGGATLIGVGQDEAGARLAPQFYAPAVDYTTTHPWWNNDDLLWDMLLDKTLAKPNLIQETGVMLVRDVDMLPWRSEQECANLLERKLITGLAARGAGLIQWLWHTNAYMTSDNENSIGLLRADGSAKPELGVMLEFGRLMSTIGTQIQETTPDVWVVVPYSQWFLRPELAIEATRRAIRILGYDFGIVPQVVAEQQLAELAGSQHQPRFIILPAVQTLQQDAWQALRAFVQRGATLLVSGVLSRDQHNLSLPSILLDEQENLPTLEPVSRYERLEGLPDATLQFIFGQGKMAYVRKAHNTLKSMPIGNGKVIWSGLPLELSETPGAVRQVYQHALHIPARLQAPDQESPLLVVKQPLQQGSLFLVVSESSSRQRLVLDAKHEINVLPNRAGALLVHEDGSVVAFGGVEIRPIME